MTTYKKLDKQILITDNKVLTKYVFAFVLGDGYLYRPSKDTHNSYFATTQLTKNEDYILWRADILSNITSVHLSEKLNIDCLETTTARHPFFTNMRNNIYVSNVKRIDPHYLKLFDWEVMAILYQDDGYNSRTTGYNHSKTRKYQYHSIGVATNCYSYGDCLLLWRASKEKLGIEWNIQKKTSRTSGELQYILSLPRRFNSLFLAGVKPYIKPSFYYKLELSNEGLQDTLDDEIVRSASKDAALPEMSND